MSESVSVSDHGSVTSFYDYQIEEPTSSSSTDIERNSEIIDSSTSKKKGHRKVAVDEPDKELDKSGSLLIDGSKSEFSLYYSLMTPLIQPGTLLSKYTLKLSTSKYTNLSLK